MSERAGPGGGGGSGRLRGSRASRAGAAEGESPAGLEINKAADEAARRRRRRGRAAETLGRRGPLQLAAAQSKAGRAPERRGRAPCRCPRGARLPGAARSSPMPRQDSQGLRLRGRVGEGQLRAPPRPLAGPRLRAARGYPMPL